MKWSSDELQFIKDNYNSKGIAFVSKSMPNRSYVSVYHVAHRLGLICRHICSVDENFFKEWSPEMAWCLGLLFSDGNICSGKIIQLTSDDKDIIDKFKCYTSSTYSVAAQSRINSCGISTTSYKISIYNVTMYKTSVELGLMERKSLSIVFPISYPDVFMPDFIRGLWDGDGSILKDKKWNIIRCVYTSGSRDFIMGLSKFIGNVLGIEVGFGIVNNSYYHIQLSSSNANKLCNYMYHDNMGDAFMKRKYDVWKRFDSK